MNTTKGLNEVRVALFATLDGLLCKDKPMEVDRAKAVASVADQLIKSAKVEVEFLKVTGGVPSGFVPRSAGALPNGAKRTQDSDGEGQAAPLPKGGEGAFVGVTRHLLGK